MNRSTSLLLATTLGLVAGGLPSVASADCEVTGTVVDADGRPVEGLDVHLTQGDDPPHTVTDAEGRFRFAAVSDETEVIATLGEGGPAPRFSMVDGGEPVQLRARIDPAGRCEVELGPSQHPMGPDLLALYQNVRRGLALMKRLGINPGEPLRVEVNDAIASPSEAFWVGTSSFHVDQVIPPRLVLGTAATLANDPGAPDNREYHELGHHALAAAFGALPQARNDTIENDYHHNPSSAHAWTEGFAIFFAAMVAQEIEDRPDAGRYRVEGAFIDLELDYRPWDLRGTESVAVASLLWDVVDGARPSEGPDLEVLDARVLQEAGVPSLLVGRVENTSSSDLRSVRVQVKAEGWNATAPVGPPSVPHGGEGWFALPLPADVAQLDDPIAALDMSATSIPAASDDDPVQVPLPELWTAIAQLRSEQADSNGRLFDVADLYQALRGYLGGKDSDGDGRDDIDQLFIAHGLFGDVDGDRQYDPDETVGLTSHPAHAVEIDGAAETWPERLPRHRLALPAGLRMQVDAPADATLVVLTSGSSWGGYVAVPDANGWIRLVPPPAREGAHVSVVALASGRRPTVVWHEDATALLDALEAHPRPYLAATAELPTASGFGDPSSSISSWPRLAFGGGALTALLGLVLIVVGWPRLPNHA